MVVYHSITYNIEKLEIIQMSNNRRLCKLVINDYHYHNHQNHHG